MRDWFIFRIPAATRIYYKNGRGLYTCEGDSMEDMKEILKDVETGLAQFASSAPGKMNAFGGLMNAIESQGSITTKNKELIAIALSVACHCKWCIAFHVNRALEEGASEDEIKDAMWMAVLMGGGPSLMYGQLVLKAIDDLKK